MYVVTIDQRHSRSEADRVPELLRALAGVTCVARFERTAGDEIQGLLDDPTQVRHAILATLREGDWHCGIGVGLVDAGSFAEGVRAGRGPAFLAAREAVEAAKGMTASVAVRTNPSAGEAARWAADCQALWHLVAALVLGRTAAQWRVVDAVDRAPTQSAAATQLGMQPGSVTGALRLSHIREERAAYDALDRLLTGAEHAATTTPVDQDEKEA